ncbi:MAG: lasso peptide biosynthesis B2 protein [Pseudonocardiaceae bacterium]
MNEILRAARSPTVRWLLPAALVCAVVELALRSTMTLPRLSSLLGIALQLGPDTRTELPPSAPALSLGARDAARFRAACRVLRIWPGTSTGGCLRRALVAGCLLRRRRPELHLGVAHIDGRTVAHAWLTIDGVVLDPTAQQYTPLVQGVG